MFWSFLKVFTKEQMKEKEAKIELNTKQNENTLKQNTYSDTEHNFLDYTKNTH